ncbi:MAG: hypothetical protein K5697_11240 [Lachnospiraceae bacterium]|nr:hypothetical protein [Lachnospiraceae bacterium]
MNKKIIAIIGLFVAVSGVILLMVLIGGGSDNDDGAANGIDDAVRSTDIEQEEKEVKVPSGGESGKTDRDAESEISEKSDEAAEKERSYDFYARILDGKTTIQDLQRQGYDISYDKEYVWPNVEFGDIDDGAQLYRFKNSDTCVITFDYDMTQNIPRYPDAVILEHPVIRVVQGPAGELASDRIGKAVEPFLQNGCLFLPEREAYEIVGFWSYPYPRKAKAECISDTTRLIICTEETVGTYRFNDLIYNNMVLERAGIQFSRDHSFWNMEITGLIETEEYHLVQVEPLSRCWDNEKGEYVYYSVEGRAEYRIYKDDYRIEVEMDNAVISSEPAMEAELPFLVKVYDVPIWTGPGEGYTMTGRSTGEGIFTIVEVQNGFGKLKSGAGWIELAFAQRQ